MREHKYRARWEDTGEVIPDFMEDYAIDALNDDSFIVEEWTGLKDKNGKDIYDGDIVRLNGWDDYKQYTNAGAEENYIGLFLIKIEVDTFGIEVKWESIKGYACPTHIIGNDEEGRLRNAEVIGNIFQNPELLE